MTKLICLKLFSNQLSSVDTSKYRKFISYLYCPLKHTVCQNGSKLQIHVGNLALLVALWFIISSNPITAIGQVKPQSYSNQDRGAELLHILHQNFSHFPFCVIIKNSPLWNWNSSITDYITKIGETHAFENSLNDLWWCQRHFIGLSLIVLSLVC